MNGGKAGAQLSFLQQFCGVFSAMLLKNRHEKSAAG
jgi:hypothetical protein